MFTNFLHHEIDKYNGYNKKGHGLKNVTYHKFIHAEL